MARNTWAGNHTGRYDHIVLIAIQIAAVIAAFALVIGGTR